MRPLTSEEALIEIGAHIDKQGGIFSNWYAGITNDWKNRLNQHKVSDNDITTITCQCTSPQDARAVEQALIKKGCMGGTTGGSNDSVYVYAYKIGPKTVQ